MNERRLRENRATEGAQCSYSIVCKQRQAAKQAQMHRLDHHRWYSSGEVMLPGFKAITQI